MPDTEKTLTWLVTFFTHSGAIAFCRRAKSAGVAAKMLPVPRALSSSCGTGVSVAAPAPPLTLVDDDVDKVYSPRGAGYALVLDNDTAG